MSHLPTALQCRHPTDYSLILSECFWPENTDMGFAIGPAIRGTSCSVIDAGNSGGIRCVHETAKINQHSPAM